MQGTCIKTKKKNMKLLCDQFSPLSCSFLLGRHLPFLFPPNIFLSTLVLEIVTPCSSLNVQTEFHVCMKERAQL